jgi:hypothetical protein
MINTDIKLENKINIFSKMHEVICYFQLTDYKAWSKNEQSRNTGYTEYTGHRTETTKTTQD